MTTVYARVEGTIIFSDNNGTHKAGRVPINTPLEVIKTSNFWYAIERPINLSLPENPSYPSYWVRAIDIMLSPAGVVEEPRDPGIPIPPWHSDVITDEAAAAAMLTLIRWVKEL